MSVWPSGCVCQLLRAPGSKVTYAPLARAGAGALKSWSIRTVPVKYSAGPLAEGCDPFRFSSIAQVLSLFRCRAAAPCQEPGIADLFRPAGECLGRTAPAQGLDVGK